MASPLQQKIELLLSLSEDPKSKAQLTKFLKNFDQVQKAVNAVNKMQVTPKGTGRVNEALGVASKNTALFERRASKLFSVLSNWPSIKKQVDEYKELEANIKKVSKAVKDIPKAAKPVLDVPTNIVRTMNALKGGEKFLPFMRKYEREARALQAVSRASSMRNLAPMVNDPALLKLFPGAVLTPKLEKTGKLQAGREAKKAATAYVAEIKKAEAERVARVKKENAAFLAGNKKRNTAADTAAKKAADAYVAEILRGEQERVRAVRAANAALLAKLKKELAEAVKAGSLLKRYRKKQQDEADQLFEEQQKKPRHPKIANVSSLLGKLGGLTSGTASNMLGSGSSLLGNIAQFGFGKTLGFGAAGLGINAITGLLKFGFNAVSGVVSSTFNVIKGLVNNIVVKLGALIGIATGVKQVLDMIKLGNEELKGQFKADFLLFQKRLNPTGVLPKEFESYLNQLVLKTSFRRNDIRDAITESMALGMPFKEIQTLLPIALGNAAALGRSNPTEVMLAYVHNFLFGLQDEFRRMTGIIAKPGENIYARIARELNTATTKFKGMAELLGKADVLGKLSQLTEGIKQQVGYGLLGGLLHGPMSKGVGWLSKLYMASDVDMTTIMARQLFDARKSGGKLKSGIFGRMSDLADVRQEASQMLLIRDLVTGQERQMNFWEYAFKNLFTPLIGMYSGGFKPGVKPFDKASDFPSGSPGAFELLMARIKNTLFAIIPSILQFFISYEITKWQYILKLIIGAAPSLIMAIVKSVPHILASIKTGGMYDPTSKIAGYFNDAITGLNGAIANLSQSFSPAQLRQTPIGQWALGGKNGQGGIVDVMSKVFGAPGQSFIGQLKAMHDMYQTQVGPQAASNMQLLQSGRLPVGTGNITPLGAYDDAGFMSNRQAVSASPTSIQFASRTYSQSPGGGVPYRLQQLQRGGFQPRQATNIPATTLTADQMMNGGRSAMILFRNWGTAWKQAPATP